MQPSSTPPPTPGSPAGAPPGAGRPARLRPVPVALLVACFGALAVLVSAGGPDETRERTAPAPPVTTAPPAPAPPSPSSLGAPERPTPREPLPLDREQALDERQVQRLMLEAGFPHSELGTGVALTLEESERVPAATNDRARVGVDRGLWQINDHYWGEEIDVTDWQDPAKNTRIAFHVWSVSGWDAWAAYEPGEMDALPPPAPDALPLRHR